MFNMLCTSIAVSAIHCGTTALNMYCSTFWDIDVSGERTLSDCKGRMLTYAHLRMLSYANLRLLSYANLGT